VRHQQTPVQPILLMSTVSVINQRRLPPVLLMTPSLRRITIQTSKEVTIHAYPALYMWVVRERCAVKTGSLILTRASLRQSEQRTTSASHRRRCRSGSPISATVATWPWSSRLSPSNLNTRPSRHASHTHTHTRTHTHTTRHTQIYIEYHQLTLRTLKPRPHQQQCRSNRQLCRSNIRLCCQKRQQCRTNLS